MYLDANFEEQKKDLQSDIFHVLKNNLFFTTQRHYILSHCSLFYSFIKIWVLKDPAIL